MAMQLYGHPLSTYTRRVRIYAIEKSAAALGPGEARLELEEIEVDMAAGAHRKPEFLALNPYGKVPVLRDGDFVLYESVPILLYLEQLHPNPPLWPTEPKAQAHAHMLIRSCDLYFATQADRIVFPKRFLPEARWDREDMAQAGKRIQRHLGAIDELLRDREYLIGSTYSLVDLCYVPALHFLPVMDVAVPDRVAAWAERLSQRESSRATAPAH